MKKGISLIVLIITIIIIIIISSIVIANLFGDNGILSNANRAKVNNNIAEKQDELNIAAGQALIEISKGNKSGEPTVSGDFVQPWYCDSFSVNDWNNHIKILKRAGINTIILQWTAEFSNNKIKYLGYESDLVKDNNNLDSSFDVNTYNQKSKYMLENLLKAAQNNNMKVYIGLSIGNDWWNNSFTNNDWCNSNAALTNKIANEIYNKYKINYLDTFVGWYWPWELYTTKNNYEVNWSYFLNMCLDNLTSLDSNMPMILAPYISTSENASVNRSYDEFKNLVSTTNFRDGDIICLQDSLGTSTYSVDQVIEYIKSIKKAVKTNPKLKFWLDVENYQTDASENTVSASSNRFIDQLLIGSLYAENMISFSYLHYYDPLKDGISSEYNNSYKNYTFSYKTANLIDPPNGGSIYRDKNGDEAPIPAGFKVSSKLGENLIESGLVVEDNYGNQFVWIPIDGGIVSDGNYDYNIDGKMLEYKKWLSYSNLKDDELPNGVTSEEEQVKKYDGFYISRYEAMFDYNNGNIRVAIKPSKNNTQTEDWRSSRDKYHDGYLWNFITYSDAKYFSEKMSTAYSYNSSIKTGLVNGRQWDTIMRLLDLNNINIYNSVTWGNYDNSESPANTGNYIKGKLQNSGSNENWKAFNIYDMAGNLAEWTSEINSQNTEQSVYRSTDFSGNGMYGPVSYRAFSDTGDYAYPNIGFRVVMYLE